MVGGATLERGSTPEEAVDYREPIIVPVERQPSASLPVESREVVAAEQEVAEFVAESPFEEKAIVAKEAENLEFQLGRAAWSTVARGVDYVRNLPRTYDEYKKRLDMDLFLDTIKDPGADLPLEKAVLKSKIDDRKWRIENGWVDPENLGTAQKEIQSLLTKLQHVNAVEQERLPIRQNIAEHIRNHR